MNGRGVFAAVGPISLIQDPKNARELTVGGLPGKTEKEEPEKMDRSESRMLQASLTEKEANPLLAH